MNMAVHFGLDLDSLLYRQLNELSLWNMANLSKAEVDDIREVFEVFDFWDGRDGMVDASRVPDLLRCTGLSPTEALCLKHGALMVPGEYQYTFEEFLSVYQGVKDDVVTPDKETFMHAFRSYDRESQGVLTVAQLSHILEAYGEKMSDEEMDTILDCMGYKHGMVKYAEFIDRVLEDNVIEQTE